MSGLHVTDLSFSYGPRRILRNVELKTLQKGQLTALIGPNAAGKSTLFKCIAGLNKPSQGTVTLNGTDLSSLSGQERLKRVCFMPQFFAANAALTVFDVVMMAQKQLRGWRVKAADTNAVARALDAGGIAHLAEAYVGELSGGQAQMVSVVQSLVRQSEAYLFDEPTSALDLRHQLQVLERIRVAIKNRNAVGMVALHDLNLAARFADHLILIGKGEILAQGAPKDVLRDPKIAEIYGVYIELGTGPRKDLLVHAYAS
ncbi:MAG: ABC transporter ATP-binding protein [Cognatishimia sp.]